MKKATEILLAGLLVLGAGAIGCGRSTDSDSPTAEEVMNGIGESKVKEVMNRIAESYVRLVLAVGQHDADYVDAYSGPAEWRTEAEAANQPLVDITAAAAPLIAELERTDDAGQEEIVRLRRQYLLQQLKSLVARVAMLEGKKLTFDEESKALYDAVSPSFPESHYQDALDRLAAKLPGDGPIAERYRQFKKAFIIPTEKLDTVFTAAIEEARRRTRAHIDLPDGESFRVEYVTDQPWSGYNWYKGNGHSLIQVNTDLPIYIDRAVDLACHEGYPGHHVYNVLLEHHLVRQRGWIEFTIYPLFSPQSLIAEGSANYGMEVAFSPDDRLAFEHDVLFPLAGLDPSRVEEYYDVEKLARELRYAGNDAARRYLDGVIDRRQAAGWLNRYSLMSPPRAEQRVKFIDKYRSYVINYNLGEDLVKRHIEGRGGTAGRPAERWSEFGKLLASPRLPSGLGTAPN